MLGNNSVRVEDNSGPLIERLKTAIAANDHQGTARALVEIGLKSEGGTQIEDALIAADEKVRGWRLPRGIDWIEGEETVTVVSPGGFTREVPVFDGYGRRNTTLGVLITECVGQIRQRTGYKFERFRLHFTGKGR